MFTNVGVPFVPKKTTGVMFTNVGVPFVPYNVGVPFVLCSLTWVSLLFNFTPLAHAGRTIKKTQPQGLGFDLYQTPLKPLVAAPEAF